MIDKNPFKVTNEQALALAIGGKGARTLLRSVDNITEFMQDISADLLDARELINKQETLIKEMRNLVKTLYLECEMYEVDINHCWSILEKSKEYV